MYPLKYAVKKTYRATGNFNCFGEQDLELYEYEASKCYLAKEHKTYQKCTDAEVKYEVSFPRVDSWNGEEIFDVDVNFYGQLYNTEFVNIIFDTIEEANIEVKKLNSELQIDIQYNM